MDSVRSLAAPRLIALAAALAGSACTSRPILEASELPACERCHGGNGSAAPPRSTRGRTETTDRAVGAHARHLALQGDDVRAALPCETCHEVPGSETHADGVVEVRFRSPAGEAWPSARWNPQRGRCENVYCHGATLRAGSQGSATEPEWTRVDGSQLTCGSCHAAPPGSHAAYPGASGGPAGCHGCHGETVKADGTIDVAAGRHIDGAVQAPSGSICGSCHGAPPDTGAHRAHANAPGPASLSYGSLAVEVGTSPTGQPAYVFGCGYCHPLDAADHLADAGGDGLPDVAIAPAGAAGLKALNDPAAAWDYANGSCSGVYCHGATLGAGSRGTATAPVWTRVDGTQKTCSSCHAQPPASHRVYASPSDCQRCHAATLSPDGSIDVAARAHLDGSTPVPAACNACHLAPPETGAHRAHANPADVASVSYGSLAVDAGTSPAGQPAYVFGCGHCHPLDPADHRVDAGGDGLPDVALSPAGAAGLRALNDPAAAWSPSDARCSGVYCHGATLRASSRGAATAPAWTTVDGSQRTCGSCHAAPPGSHAAYPSPTSCRICHSQTVKQDGTIDVPGLKHVDGTVEALTGTACNGCHAAPPDTGAHRAHANPPDPSGIAYGGLTVLEDVAPNGGASYDFGCGHCHPIDPADHFADAGGDGLPDVVLTPPATPVAGDLVKARNAASAAWDRTTGTCSGVYCHSSGQETPAYVATPAWTSPPGVLGCSGCHGNPPQYASGGPGAADANSHVNLDSELGTPTTEFGHFAGMPGPDHVSKHGGGDPGTWGSGQRASPITCQACHFETVDPAKVRGASGFFYFDPDGDYDLRPGGGADRATQAWWLASQCTACHASELGSGGRVLPLRHVNGKRDVAFDRRRALPAGYATGLPALKTGDPVRPYYMTTRGGMDVVLTAADCVNAPEASCGVVADVALRETLVPATPPATGLVAGDPVLTLTLEHASYDPATKTCSAVACHLERQRQVEAGTTGPLQWGAPYLYLDPKTCSGCHQQ